MATPAEARRRILFDFGEGNLVGILAGIFRDFWTPKGPKTEKIQDRPPGLKFSIEIENFNLDTQETPIFCGEF